MNLYIFDASLVFIGMLDDITTLQWIRRYAKHGEFELHCPLTADVLVLLQRGNIIWKQGGTEAGCIDYRQMVQGADGQETLIVKGKFLSGYLARRIIWGRSVFHDTAAETAMRLLVTQNVISPTNADRTIPDFILGTLGGFTQTVDYQISYANLLDEIENLCALSGLGYRVALDIPNRHLVFEVYAGLDRTSSQSVNSRAIFSQEFENILTQDYTDSLNSFRNVALVGGMGEDAARTLVTVGAGVELDRLEMFVDAKDLTNVVNEVTMTAPEYTATLIARGDSKLAEALEIRTFEATVDLLANLVYKTDFDLGDIVTVASNKWGLSLDARITEIQEAYAESGESIQVIFGNNVPTLLSIIKKMR